MENRNLVVKDNALIEASFNLSLVEHRLMLLAIVEARELVDLNASTQIEVRAERYAKQFHVHEKEAYGALKSACELLFERRFSYIDRYKGNSLIKKVRWVSEIGYLDNQGCVLINLSDTVVGLISRLEEQFTRYYLNQVSDFKSKYSLRLYELVIKWLTNGCTQKYELIDLRAKLGLTDTEYKTMSLFKANVIDKAINEINKKTDITVSYEQFKQGRTITHILFKMKQKHTKQKKQTEKVISFTEKQLDMFSEKLSKLPSFQNHYIADTGASTEEYAQQIKAKLSEPTTVKQWIPYLNEVGYKGI